MFRIQKSSKKGYNPNNLVETASAVKLDRRKKNLTVLLSTKLQNKLKVRREGKSYCLTSH